MTTTPTKQTPSECKHFYRGRCRIDIKAVYRQRRATPDFVCDYCRGVCPDYEPKEKKDGNS